MSNLRKLNVEFKNVECRIKIEFFACEHSGCIYPYLVPYIHSQSRTRKVLDIQLVSKCKGFVLHNGLDMVFQDSNILIDIIRIVHYTNTIHNKLTTILRLFPVRNSIPKHV